jgi:integrase
MPSDRTPQYRRHKQSGQAIVTLPDGQGGRKDVLLGKWRSKESRQEYHRVVAEWEAAGRHLPCSLADAENDLTINELILRFWPHAEQHYRHADGTPTNELNDFRLSLKPLRETYGRTSAKDFGPLALKALRQKMIAQPITTTIKEVDHVTGKAKLVEKVLRVGLARGVINQRISRIRRMFRWAVENELAPPSVLHALQAVRGLQAGRSAARETAPVRPVSDKLINDTLPFLTPTVAAMVRLQRLTGMRSGELVIMRGCDLDTTGDIWLYRPSQHKNSHRGLGRVIPLGPRARKIVSHYLKTDTQAYLFCPRESVDAFRRKQRAKRKSPVQPSQINRKRNRPQRVPGERYDVRGFAHAIRRACERNGLEHWHPHQLRHAAATTMRRAFGLDATRAMLGQHAPQITELYAELDMTKAIEVAVKLG